LIVSFESTVQFLPLIFGEGDVVGVLSNAIPKRLSKLDSFCRRHVEKLIDRDSCHRWSLLLDTSVRPTFLPLSGVARDAEW
jgi:hypothetical protein